MLVKAILLGLVSLVAVVDSRLIGRQNIGRPLILSTLAGLVLGDMKQGIILGASLELMSMGFVSIGAAGPPNMQLGSVIATAFAILSGATTEEALSLAIPVAVAGEFLSVLMRMVIAQFSHVADKAIDEGKDVFIEGSQGFGLSLYYGTYPYVTSKDTCASTAAADVGVGPTKVDEVIVIFKSYITRVGEGPFPTEISPEEAEKMGIEEYGVVTGRKRRVGLFDKDFAKRSCMINGATQIALTCIDRLYPECAKVNKYEDLSQEARDYIEDIEESVGVPITIISTGPDLADTIDLRNEKLN